MSSQSVALNTGQQAIIHTDLSKIFILNNRYQKDNYVNNSSYNPISLSAGTVMGRVSATGVLAPLNAGASDGTQFPVGILAQDLEIDSGETVSATICDAGDIAAEKVIFFTPGNGLETVVSSRRMKDHIAAQGMNLVSSTEMTQEDND